MDEVSRCGWVDPYGDVCNARTQGDTVKLHDRLMAGIVSVCTTHKAAYNRAAAELRNTIKSPTTKRSR